MRWRWGSAGVLGVALWVGQLAACASDSATERSSDSSVPPLDPGPDEGAPVGKFYVVQPGDTLAKIARAHGVPADELVEMNGLSDPDLLQVGQIIFVPDDDTLGLAPKPKDPTQRPVPQPIDRSAQLMWPLDGGVLLREFGPHLSPPSDGLVLAAPKGTAVRAAADGEVVFAGEDNAALGRMVILKHPASGEGHVLLTIYAHLDTVDVAVGAKVQRGAAIGTVGDSGRVESPQLHFQVREGRTPIDPLILLPPP